MHFLRQSTASQSVLLGPFVDDTDGTTAETGLTIANTDIRLSANGGNIVAKNSGGGTHDELGYYTITLDATDTATVGTLRVVCKMSGALVVDQTYQVVEEAVYDALFASSATGYNATTPLDAAGIRSALGLATANLDTQLADLPTVAEFEARTLVAANYFDPATDTVASVTTVGSVSGAVGSVTGAVGSVTGNVGGNVTGSVGSVLGGINTAAGTITTLDGLDTAQDTQHSSTQASIAALNDLSAAEVNAEVDTALADIYLDHLLAVDYDPATPPGTATALLNELVESDGGVSRFTSNALENAPGGGGGVNVTQINGTSIAGTGSQVAAAFEFFFNVATPSKTVNDVGVAGAGLSAEDVWTYGTRVLTAGTNLNDLDAAGIRSAVGLATANLDTQLADLPTVAEFTARTLVSSDYATASALSSVDTGVSSVLTQAALIVADTNELQTDWANGGRLDTILDTAASAGGLTAAAVADAVWTEAVGDHSSVSGSMAQQLAAAGSAGDPWVTEIPGSYTAGQAGYVVGTQIKEKTDLIAPSSITVTPVLSGSGAKIDVTAKLKDTSNITIPTTTDYTGATLKIVFEGSGTTDIATIESGSITVTTNTITFAKPDLGVTAGTFIYSIRDTADGNKVIVDGTWHYIRSAYSDPVV